MKFYELNDDNVKELTVVFFQFGEQEGFLEKNENDKYEFTHDVPTFRLNNNQIIYKTLRRLNECKDSII